VASSSNLAERTRSPFFSFGSAQDVVRVAILTSGGDSPGMNAAIRACARITTARGHEAFLVSEGYQGTKIVSRLNNFGS
jgi:hypothetical protein